MSIKSNHATKKKTTPAQRANLLSGAEWLQHSFSVWRELDKNSEERQLKHPAMFTSKLVERILESYTCKSGVLLDPFAGSGTALLAALNNNMEAVGLDINPHYRKIFEDRVGLFGSDRWLYHVIDARCLGEVVLPQSIDICVTSPPYWDILNRRRTADGKATRPYSNAMNDLGNIEAYDEFLISLGEILSLVRMSLKPGAYFVLNVMDLRKGTSFYPLHMDATNIAQKSGFELQDIIIWDRQKDYNNMRPLGYPYKFIVNKVHEYLLVFR
ncbi:DNA methyltransferase [Candidatus Spongiihabitans sp.]|uniref:DNA methyltransferase n=1 Tax=Candidatus Spongiihabitans sp. TaxID=3101308 RepID=UPI003C7C57EE